jgi:hypothetical protein
MADTALATTAETYADFGEDSKGRCAYWKAEIHACDKEMEKWRERAAKVVKRYRDEREGDSGLGTAQKKYNLLWSIINTMMPAVYGRPPAPIVMRRYTDPDQVARVASLILERVLAFQLSAQSDFHPTVRHALQDRLLPGMGCAWVRYQKAQNSPTGTVDNDYYARLSGNVAAVDFVYWEDFGFIPSRTWEEVPAVWRIVYMTRDELEARFPKVKDIPLDYTPARHPDARGNVETDEPKHNVFKQAKVYEIWDKRSSKVCWVHMAMETLLDEKPDPMGFPGFFPCPRPLFATNTTGNLVPVPDYCMYQDQAGEIDNLTQRLDMLTKALKVVGVRDASEDGLARLLTEGAENELIPVDTWAAFAEKGGLKGVMDFLPIEQVILVVEKLFNIRQQLIQDIYQITGISDIVRGASNPNETLGAQKIKQQFASMRLDAVQQDLARFVGEIVQLMGHVAITFFDDQTLIEQSAIMHSPDGQKAIKDAQAAMAARQAPPPMMPPTGSPGEPPPAPMGTPPVSAQPPAMPPMGGGGMLPANVVPFAPPAAPAGPLPPPPLPSSQGVVMQALQLLRNGKMIDYRIEVTADTLVEPDLEQERAARNEFLTGVTQFLQQAIPAVQGNPQFMPIAQALLMFGIRGFRVGRDIEGIIEAAFEDMKANPPPKQPDPKTEALKAKAASDQQKVQMEGQARQAEIAAEAQARSQELGMEMQKMQAEMANDRAKVQMEMEAFREKTMAEVQAILIKAQVQAQAARDKAAQDATIASAQMQGDIVQGAQEMAHADAAHEQDMAHQQEAGALALEQQKQAAKAAPKDTGGDG